MARALSHDTRLIIMDEPSAVLDSEEVENLFRVIRDLTAAGRRGRLHLAPARGDPPDRRPDHRAQGRPHRRHRPPGRGHPDRGADPADDRPRRSSTSSRRRPSHRPPAPRSRARRSTDLSRAGVFDDVELQRARRARSSASPAWSARAAPRSSRRSTAPAGPRPAPSRSTASGCAPGSVVSAVEAGLGLAPEERKSQGLLLDEAVYQQHHDVDHRPVRARRLPRRAAERASRRAGRRPSTSGQPASATARTSRAATSRRSCWPAGCCATAGCCCSTSPPAASTSAPAARSTADPAWPTPACRRGRVERGRGGPRSVRPRAGGREGRVLRRPADEIDENRSSTSS